MTQYFLHGGYSSKKSEKNKIFFLQILKSFTEKEKVNILIILFAREKNSWKKKFEDIKNIFSLYHPLKNFHFELASEESETFIDQIKKADILFLSGGESHTLQKQLEKVPMLKILFKDKIIAGSSAGCLVFSRYYYENDDDTYNTGLGFIDVKLLCHYDKNTNDEAKEKLENFGEKDIVVYTLKEEEFLVIER